MLTKEQMKVLRRINVSENSVKTRNRIAEDFKMSSNDVKNEIVDLSGLTRRAFYNVFDTGSATAKVVVSMAQTLNVSPYYYTGRIDHKDACTDEVLNSFLHEHKYFELMIKPKRKINRKPKIETEALPEQDEQSKDTEVEVPEQTENADEKQIHIAEFDSNLPSEVSEPSEADADVKDVVDDELKSDISDTDDDNDDDIDIDDIDIDDIDFDIDDFDDDDDDDDNDDADDNMISISVTLDNSPKMQEAIAALDDESAIFLLKALNKRAEAGGSAEDLCNLVKRCLLS